MASSPPAPPPRRDFEARLEWVVRVMGLVNAILLLAGATLAALILDPVVIWKLAHGHDVSVALLGGSGLSTTGVPVGILVRSALGAAKRKDE